MACVGRGYYVVVVLHVGGSKAFDIKLFFQREPRYRKTWLPSGSILPNEEHVDAAVRELHEENGLILTHDDLTVLSDAPVRVAIYEGQQQLKLKLFTTCTVCAGLQQLPYAPVAISGPSQQCHTGNLQVRARPLTT
jgi:8-oxo-dGTP pyrophosphatase MutT (NUDIX family)